MSRWSLSAVCTAALFLAGPLSAQTTFATITGAVTDSTGALIPGVKVAVTNVATNIETATKSNEAGIYTVPQLTEGEYRLKAAQAGFQEILVDKIVLQARDIRRIDLRLEVGQVTNTVEVSAGATLIETETARLSNTKSFKVIDQLPVSRSVYGLMGLSPNVIQGAGGSSTYQVAGSVRGEMHQTLDGITTSDTKGQSNSPLTDAVESLQEVRFDILNTTAESPTVGQIAVVSKSGTNQLHGSVFDFYSTTAFNATNPFSHTQSSGVDHSPGFTVGGPVWIPKIYNGRNKTFFFFDWETSMGGTPRNYYNPTVPLAAWRNGDFSGLTGGVKIYDPTNQQPFPGNVIPASRINPVSQKIQNMYYPLPNMGSTTALTANNFQLVTTYPYQPSNTVVERIDHRFNDKDAIYGRFTFYREHNVSPEGNLPAMGLPINTRNMLGLAIPYTHIFKSSIVNEFRIGFAYNNNPKWSSLNGGQIVKDLGFVGLVPNLPDYPGSPSVSFSGISLQGISASTYYNPGYRNHSEDIQDIVTWFRGRHSLKFGMQLTGAHYGELSASSSLFGSLSFSNRFTGQGISGQGNPYADFLLGYPSTVSRAYAPLESHLVRWQYAFFVQDDFKVNPKLTVNLGLRYGLLPNWHEDNGRISVFNISCGCIVVPDGALPQVSKIFPSGFVSVAEARTLGLPGGTLVNLHKKDFAPRIGVAYRPWGANTVIRAGAGIYYVEYPAATASSVGVPYLINEPSYTNPLANPDVILPRVFPVTATVPTSVSLPSAVDPNVRNPYSMNYSITIEHQQWNTGFSISYVGNTARELVYNPNANSPLPDARLYVNKPRLFPKYSSIGYAQNGAFHQYHGLNLETKRQMANGLYFQAFWVWAKDLGDCASISGCGSSENPYNRARDKGPTQGIPQYRYNVNWIYQLPVGKGKHWLPSAPWLVNAALGGWEVSGVLTHVSNNYLTPSWSGPDPVGIANTSSSTPANVSMRPSCISNPNLPGGERSIGRWFDTKAFAAPAAGEFGSCSRGSIIGPGLTALHGELFKNFVFSEKGPVNLRIYFRASNALNHLNWSNPGLSLSSPQSFGVISNVGGVNGSWGGDRPGPRSLNLGFRMSW